MCLYSELQLDAGVLHDHLINHTNENNLLVLYSKGEKSTFVDVKLKHVAMAHFRCDQLSQAHNSRI